MTPTREAGLKRLKDFLPRAGRNYAISRNFDHGPGNRSNISMLSPYIRHRLITEQEVSKAVLDIHGPRAAEKFLQEIAWRTYWKGWLEMRPAVWTDYRRELSSIPRNSAYHQATEGRTGIDCLDTWTRELVELGYLHNHTRMWFASIWIFTLRLPWQLGADFFMRHLIDADPASNTLSWRWVAGLHTPGKHYLARASNINRYTSGRFNPVGQLDESAKPLPLDRSDRPQPLELDDDPSYRGRIGHLMTPDDLSPCPADPGMIASTAIIHPPAGEATNPPARFLAGAIEDTCQRLGATLLEASHPQSVNEWIEREQLDHVICSWPAVGPADELVKSIDFPIQPFVRAWDRALWPRATAGFFKLKKALPKLHRSLTDNPQLELF